MSRFLIAIPWLLFTAINRVNWWYVTCDWSHPYGSTARQRARSEDAACRDS